MEEDYIFVLKEMPADKLNVMAYGRGNWTNSLKRIDLFRAEVSQNFPSLCHGNIKGF